MNYSNPRNPDTLSESIVMNQKIIPYFYQLGYQYLDINVKLQKDFITAIADLVVYLDEDKTQPYIVAEVKSQIPAEITLLAPSVQQVFSYAAYLGESVRYLLVTDGIHYHWFERSSGGRSLLSLENAPHAYNQQQLALFSNVLQPITDPQHFFDLMHSVMQILVREGTGYGLRMGSEINRILIAKLHDEQNITLGRKSLFSSDQKTESQLSIDIASLFNNALAQLSTISISEGIWNLSPRVLKQIVVMMEKYAFSTITHNAINQLFWHLFSDMVRLDHDVYTTPLYLAQFLIQLVNPQPGMRILDPACGTGLFPIESAKHLQASSEITPTSEISMLSSSLPEKTIIGIEINAEVAELALTNFVLNGLPPNDLVKADALDKNAYTNFRESCDVVVLDPPVGQIPRSFSFLHQFDIASFSNRITYEMLFVERALDFLKPGGILGILLPDTLLSSPAYARARAWILQVAIPKAIISLPVDAFVQVGHSGKASILLLEKKPSSSSKVGQVLLAEIQSLNIGKSQRSVASGIFSSLVEVVRTFMTTNQVPEETQQDYWNAWLISSNELKIESWNASAHNPNKRTFVQTLKQSSYSMVPLESLVEIIGGRNFGPSNYVEKGDNTAMVLQAGAVRDLVLDTSESPFVSYRDYIHFERIQVKTGDVLITTTGKYLGRATAIIGETLGYTLASGAVTILRPRSPAEVDPFFLAAVLSSTLGKEQVLQKQAVSSAQPYIRRGDLGSILIPLPNLRIQKDIADRLHEMLATAQRLIQLANRIEAASKEIVVKELQAGEDNA
ncbi:hypothetical protein KSX_73420 [Ktedonospora formicarum]|uniref:Uncharacterized protein n=2 Tax=Ktedonospora formicarum TaxID=2778364 RepID=A0A8J3ID65_9CHLR|nr:hypothetical protein KSX_73420 [Ktedonospora formicarum]